MPLRDHFHGWLSGEQEWSSFLCAWATFTAFELNALLPTGFRASPNVRAGTAIWHDEMPREAPTETLTIPFELAGNVAEVLVHSSRDGRYLAAVIEFVSEENKDRAEARKAFVARCETYLRNGAGLIIVDPVTPRTANLHDELMTRIGHPDHVAWGERLYATAYRPSGKNGSAQLTVWQERLAIGSPLPPLPLWLLYGTCVPVHLEATYENTFRQLRLPTEAP